MSNATSVSDLERAEHKGYSSGVGSKRVSIYGSDGVNDVQIKVNSDGSLVSDSKESTDLEGKGIITVGTTAVELTFTGTPQTVIISAPTSNYGIIYIGKSNVTTAGANSMAFLEAGESIEIDYNDSTNALYVVSDTASQSVIAGCLL